MKWSREANLANQMSQPLFIIVDELFFSKLSQNGRSMGGMHKQLINIIF
jgi:hypothetical protein